MLKNLEYHFVIVMLALISMPTILLSQSVEYDKKVGAENALLVEAYIGLYHDTLLTNYVRSVGKRLVSGLEENPFEFEFHIADDPIPNAFALPGGYVYITRGLLILMNNEDELACVLSHEIMHVIKRHSVKQMQSSILPNLVELPGNLVGTVLNENLGALINSPLTLSNQLLLSSYSRKHETQSDTKGIELASKVGYNPNAMADILSRLNEAIEYIMQSETKKSYFDSHPYTPDRVKKINKTVSKLNWEVEAPISTQFIDELDGLVFGPNPSKGIFQEQVFLHPEINFRISFPIDYNTFNQPTSVGAINPNEREGIFLEIENAGKEPSEYALEFERKLEKDHGIKTSKSDFYKVINYPGYKITIIDKSEEEIFYMHIIWIKMNKLVYKITGFGPGSIDAKINTTSKSLHVLSSKEKNTITVRVAKSAVARENESLNHLGNRLNNVINTEATAIINGINSETKLKENQTIKIVNTQKYILP